MKTNIFIGLVAFSTSITAFANSAIVFPDSKSIDFISNSSTFNFLVGHCV